MVPDPFCGCGTAVHAAQKLGRKWIGIDITSLAIEIIESRLKKAFPEAFGEEGQPRLQYEVIGTPKDLESVRDLARRDKYQFQLQKGEGRGERGAEGIAVAPSRNPAEPIS